MTLPLTADPDGELATVLTCVLPRSASADQSAVGEGRPPTPARYPAMIWLLLGGNLLVCGASFAYPFMSYHVAERGHGAGLVAMVLAAFGVGWVVGQLLCGWLVDRIGRRATLVATMAFAAVVLTLMAGVHSALVLVAGAALAGIACDAPRPVISAAISELIPDPQRRAKVDAFRFGWVINGGGAITGAAGGLLAGSLGLPALFLLNAAACAVFGVVALCCLPPDTCRAASARTGYREAFSDARLVLLLASSVATLTALMGLFAVMPTLMIAQGLSAGTFGLAVMTHALAVMTLTPMITPWLSRCLAGGPRLDILAAASVWTAVCMGVGTLAHSAAMFTVAAVACAPGEIVWFAVGAGVVHSIAPAPQRGVYHGIWGTGMAVAAVIAPILGSYGLSHGGEPVVAVSTLTVGLLGAALCLPLGTALTPAGGPAPPRPLDRGLCQLGQED
jgi:MFS family permease